MTEAEGIAAVVRFAAAMWVGVFIGVPLSMGLVFYLIGRGK